MNQSMHLIFHIFPICVLASFKCFCVLSHFLVESIFSHGITNWHLGSSFLFHIFFFTSLFADLDDKQWCLLVLLHQWTLLVLLYQGILPRLPFLLTHIRSINSMEEIISYGRLKWRWSLNVPMCGQSSTKNLSILVLQILQLMGHLWPHCLSGDYSSSQWSTSLACSFPHNFSWYLDTFTLEIWAHGLGVSSHHFEEIHEIEHVGCSTYDATYWWMVVPTWWCCHC